MKMHWTIINTIALVLIVVQTTDFIAASTSSSAHTTKTRATAPLSTETSSSTTKSTKSSIITTSFSTPPMSTSTTSSYITTNYSNSLGYSSPTFSRPNGSWGNYYYQAVKVTVYTAATFTFTSISQIDTYGCFYEFYFDPYNPRRNLLVCDDDSGGSFQFLISSFLQSTRTYILVVTTYRSGDIGAYTISAVGPTTVYMSSITPPSTTTTPPQPNFSGTLSRSSPTFSRPHGSIYVSYFYQAIQTTTFTSGTYTLQSTSSSGLDTYGCLYDTTFDPTYPYQNLLTCDDDSGGSFQFLINSYLSYGTTYVLVVTTSSSGITGDYSIIATGPGNVYMIAISPSGSHRWTVGQILGIIFGCSILLVIISVICGYRTRKRISPQQRVITPAYNVYAPGAQNNVRVNVVRTPYTVPVANAAPQFIREEEPPSYQAYMSNPKPQQ